MKKLSEKQEQEREMKLGLKRQAWMLKDAAQVQAKTDKGIADAVERLKEKSESEIREVYNEASSEYAQWHIKDPVKAQPAMHIIFACKTILGDKLEVKWPS